MRLTFQLFATNSLRCSFLAAYVLVMISSHGNNVQATDFSVSSAADIANTLPNVQPGDSLVMANGVWNNQQIQFAAMGTSAAPITLRAETPGGVTLTGSSSLNISGDWLVANGLSFDGGALNSNDHIVEFRGSLGHATNSRFTNSAIRDYNPSSIDTRYFWVSMYGANNRVDNNTFSGQNHSGVTVTVWRDNTDPDNHRIDSNHFLDRPEGNGNGFETIRIGTSAESLSDSFTVVENNLFERVDGEIEIISNKSGNNVFRHNTFRESAGTLTLRHGNDNLIEGNFFLGQNKDRSGGVRVIGERQTIVNNYFADLDGRANGAISISAGVENSALNQYFQVKDAVIAHNTIVDVVDAAITFDDGLGSSSRTLLADDVTIANNLIRSTEDPLFSGNQGSGWIWEDNIAHGQSLGPVSGNPGVSTVDPQLMLGSDGLWRINSTSPAVNSAASGYSWIVDDMDGQARSGIYDIGADEFSALPFDRTPLNAGDVGAGWFYGFIDGDFNDDGTYDCVDVDSLVVEIASAMHNSDFDLSGDGLVDVADLDNWLAEAGAANLASGNPFLPGDANLNGLVDFADFSIWNANKFTSNPSWCSGDFTANGLIDFADFSIWNANKFQSSILTAIPEPLLGAGWLAIAMGLFRSRRGLPSHSAV